MPRSARERRKLLSRSARNLGTTFTTAAIVCIAVPNLGHPERYLPSLVLMALTIVAFYFVGESRSWPWAAATYLLALSAIGAFLLPGTEPPNVETTNGIVLFASTAFPSLIAAVVASTRTGWLVVAAYLPVLVLTVLVTWGVGHSVFVVLSLLVGWLSLFVAAAWLAASLARAFSGMARLGRAHALERQASELEAQRRHGARLLHDTVLATLTLLAHSGIGVNPDALRNQAGEDARLLRQLRLGGTPMPRSSGGYTLEPVETSDLGHTLESVKQRFGRMGLHVAWHGAGQILLPSHVLDAFLLSLSECLENVRRHAGVGSADVTITEDDTTVRAMVTDSGVGFDLEAVDVGRLGLAESVIARIRDVGGKVRLFSAPGSGTTVVLEVPK